MAFPVAGTPINHPQYSGLLIPQIWSPRILEKFYEFSVLEHIANTDYEGEISAFGDTVKIRTRPTITVRDYVKGQNLIFETPPVSLVELNIDQGKYWNFLVEDVDQAQSDYDYMLDWTEDAGETLNEVINEAVVQAIPADVDANNQGATAGVESGFYDLGTAGSSIVITANNAVEKLSECSATLDEQKIPESDRWMVIPPWFKNMIYQSTLRNALVTGNDQDMLRKGHIGNLAGFDLYTSNQLLKVVDGTAGPTVWNVIFGHKVALTFANQLVHSRIKEPDDKFGIYAQGLDIYGFNLNKPDAAGLLFCRPG